MVKIEKDYIYLGFKILNYKDFEQSTELITGLYAGPFTHVKLFYGSKFNTETGKIYVTDIVATPTKHIRTVKIVNFIDKIRPNCFYLKIKCTPEKQKEMYKNCLQNMKGLFNYTKFYGLDFLSNDRYKKCSIDQPYWYCSELILFLLYHHDVIHVNKKINPKKTTVTSLFIHLKNNNIGKSIYDNYYHQKNIFNYYDNYLLNNKSCC